jgi:hypothetical protein
MIKTNISEPRRAFLIGKPSGVAGTCKDATQDRTATFAAYYFIIAATVRN